MKKTKKEDKRKNPLPQVIKGAEQLSDAKLKESLRFYIPSSIERLIKLCNSNNEAISLGALKYVVGKVLPDLKAQDITSGGDKIQGIDAAALLEKAYGSKSDTPRELHPDSDKV